MRMHQNRVWYILIFLLFLCFLLSVEEHEIHSYDYKWNTEPLSHIQWHAILEIYLILFQEFYEEAEYKNFCQTESEEETTMQLLAVILIQENHQQEENEVGDCFVKLCRMPGKHIYPFEYKCPLLRTSGDAGPEDRLCGFAGRETSAQPALADTFWWKDTGFLYPSHRADHAGIDGKIKSRYADARVYR